MLKFSHFTLACQPQCCRALGRPLGRHRSSAAAGISSEMLAKAQQPQPQSDPDPAKQTSSLAMEHRKREIVINHVLSQCRRRAKPLEVPTVVAGDQLFTMDMQKVPYPHDHSMILAHVYFANRCQIENAIKSALAAQGTWSLVPAKQRLEIWRKAADIIEQDIIYLVAHVVLGLGKTIADADADVRRLVSALRSNADYLEHLSQLRFEIQGESHVFPSFKLRPMDGFVAALAPFESLAQSASLALCPVLMGNTMLWNPALEVAQTSYLIYEAFVQAGLPKGVLNFVPSNERLFLETISDAMHFAGLNYHGAAEQFRLIFKQVADKMQHYICFPRLVAECQGKNFHFVHQSANVQTVCEASVEAAFNFSGQYSNSLSRLYVPSTMWRELRPLLVAAMQSWKPDDPTIPETLVGPVINRTAFNRLKAVIESAQTSSKLEIVCGGHCDDTVGNYVQPTIILVSDPLDPLLSEPIVGPILPVFIYADDSLTEALKLAAHQSKYALSGSIFATKDEVISHCLNHLRMSASNFYVNERCTGNPRGLTPFGGNRLSGTNDKSGSAYFLMRWSSPLLIEETIDSTSQKCEMLKDEFDSLTVTKPLK